VRPLLSVLRSSGREGPVWIAEPPFSAGARMTVGDSKRLYVLLQSSAAEWSKSATPPQTLMRTSWGPETYRAISANTPQPRYSRVYAA